MGEVLYFDLLEVIFIAPLVLGEECHEEAWEPSLPVLDIAFFFREPTGDTFLKYVLVPRELVLMLEQVAHLEKLDSQVARAGTVAPDAQQAFYLLLESFLDFLVVPVLIIFKIGKVVDKDLVHAHHDFLLQEIFGLCALTGANQLLKEVISENS